MPLNKEYLEDLKGTFSLCPTQRDKLEALVDFGKQLVELEESKRTSERKVPGCVSEVFIETIKNQDGTITFIGCSQSHIVKGYLVILFTFLKNCTPREIIEAEDSIKVFIEETGLAQSLIASRANAFGNVYTFMKKQARKYL